MVNCQRWLTGRMNRVDRVQFLRFGWEMTIWKSGDRGLSWAQHVKAKKGMSAGVKEVWMPQGQEDTWRRGGVMSLLLCPPSRAGIGRIWMAQGHGDHQRTCSTAALNSSFSHTTAKHVHSWEHRGDDTHCWLPGSERCKLSNCWTLWRVV